MVEQFIESMIIRQDNIHLPEGDPPTFADSQCDKVFEFEGKIVLKQIIKSVQNVSHNRHDYVFVIDSIDKIEEQGE